VTQRLNIKEICIICDSIRYAEQKWLRQDAGNDYLHMGEGETVRSNPAGGVSWSPLAYTNKYYARMVDSWLVDAVLTWQEKCGEVKFSWVRGVVVVGGVR